jgi:hypothetical protein
MMPLSSPLGKRGVRGDLDFLIMGLRENALGLLPDALLVKNAIRASLGLGENIRPPGPPGFPFLTSSYIIPLLADKKSFRPRAGPPLNYDILILRQNPPAYLEVAL